MNDMSLRSISALALYFLDGATESCLSTILEDVKNEAKARKHMLLGPQHLKHCLAKYPRMEAIMGRAVRDAPDIDAPVHVRKKAKKGEPRDMEIHSIESDSSGIVGSDDGD
mmetsp:Transcript_36752/g.67859  ORF Transcript_36752/g.67859 Transcript_36752/m.67859 type:complete len:111 (+) Transcript_36752:304-636(+)